MDTERKRIRAEHNISRKLRVVAALALAGVLAITAHQVWRGRVALIDATKVEMARLDMVFAEQTGRAVESVDLILRDTIDSLPERMARDPAAIEPALGRRISGVRQLLGMSLTDAAGRVLFAAGQVAPRDLGPDGRGALAAHTADAGLGLLISMPIRDPDGRWTALMTRGITGRNGAFAGIAIAFLNLAYFEDFYKAVDLTENGAIILHRRDGVVLARYPRADSIVGSSFAREPPFADILAHDIAGTVVMTSPLDGSNRVLAIRALRAFPLAVSVSVDEARILLPWMREVVMIGAAAVLAGFGLAGVLLALARRSALAELAQRLGAAEQLASASRIDPLTGLLNRTTLAEHLAGLLGQAAASGGNVAVLFLDLDGFARINDAHGHTTGDAVLRVIAERLGREAGSAMVARWGGDEFVIATAAAETTPDQSEDRAAELGQRILRSISAPIETGSQTVRLGATIGLAWYPRDGQTEEALIGAADVAMYAGKQAGGDVLRVFDPEMARALALSSQLEGELRQALDSSSLTLTYQPIVEMPATRCVAMEALVRWRHPTRGPIDPVEFIPVAEHSGLIGRLGDWALERACLDAATWPGAPGPTVTVNVSMAQITSGLLPSAVERALARSGLPPGRLQLEITESLVGAEHTHVVPVLRLIREMGVGIALDDFGTGFSSLSRLRNWPIDTIKIDRSFTRGMAGGGNAIIRATLLVAQEYGLEVTAEGVETVEQLQELLALGIRRMQGYLFARPLATEDAAKWIESHPSERVTAKRAS